MKLILSFFLLINISIFAEGLEQWKTLIKENKAIGLDIRTFPEVKLNSAKGSMHLSYFDFSQEAIQKLKMDKDKTIMVFCESGGRASRAIKDLKKAGYQKIINIKDWRTWNKIKN